MKVFLDTNILIDFVCKREPFYASAKCVFALASIGQIDKCLRFQYIQLRNFCQFCNSKGKDESEILVTPTHPNPILTLALQGACIKRPEGLVPQTRKVTHDITHQLN